MTLAATVVMQYCNSTIVLLGSCSDGGLDGRTSAAAGLH